MRIALVTCERPPVPDRDAELLAPLLRSLGATPETPAWSDPAVDWSAYDRVMISSTWDYHARIGEFRRWLSGLDDAATRVDNPPELVRWNLDKRYLRELEDRGVPVIPTVWGAPDEANRTTHEVARRGWEEVVVKPTVDLGAMNLVRTDASGVAEVAEAVPGHHMVQPFLPSLEGDGELSVVHLGGAVSHALRKLPAAGDFRVQPQYGGRHVRFDPPDDALEVARRTMAAVPARRPLYARVDLVRDLDERWSCIELELIEPALFLDVADGAAERLAALLTSP